MDGRAAERRDRGEAASMSAAAIDHHPGTPGYWRIRSYDAARAILRARHATTQAGFTAERIPQGWFTHRPILIADGPAHDAQRRELARFFAPAVIDDRYAADIDACAQAIVDDAVVTGRCRLDRAALHYTVDVTARIVGLTEAPVEALAGRLVAFFRQPPVDLSAPNWGRTNRQWLQAAINGLLPLTKFFAADVLPAIRAHRRDHRDDIISHLLDSGSSTADILVECVTYGTAGMVTTREFITVAAWRLLTDDDLRQRYLPADRATRLALLAELIRLDPIVGHLFRRVTDDLTLDVDGHATTIPAGDLIDIDVTQANVDSSTFGPDAETVCPFRTQRRHVSRPGTADERAPSVPLSAGLSFSDGAHRCPGQPLALIETDALLHRLLACEPRLLTAPTVGHDSVIAGCHLRGLELGFSVPARPRRH
ncbi:cytochrome P450 [Brevibacterium celere]